ncbi:MAG: DUF2911 domain-containing protein [Acidobacteriia bacterium]|nr:DUF2911 domain-containing protein [Terriglobia bacterium]
MKRTLARLAVFSLCMLVGLAHSQVLSALSLPPNGDNERAEVSQWIGLVKVSIEYHSPNVHGGGGADRTGHIWGELVHYGFFDDGYGPSKATPWRVGANESTTITFSHDVKVEGKDLKAGTYALFLELEPTGPWTWIFSNNIGWGSFQYDPKNDALRVQATPQDAPYTEFMTFGFDERRPSSTVAYLQWEKKRISFRIDVPNVNQLYVDQMRKELQGWPGFNYKNWATAAQFCAVRKINLEEALTWADKAMTEPFRGVTLAGRVDFGTLLTKAAILRALGRTTEADALMDKAVSLPDIDIFSLYRYGDALLMAGKNDKALQVAQLNRQRHPEEKYWTYLGLAQAYTAVGDKSNAIKNWEIALLSVPDSEKSQLTGYEKALQELKEGK